MTKPFVLRSSNAWVRYDESCEMSFGLALKVDTDFSVLAGLARRAWMETSAAREVGWLVARRKYAFAWKADSRTRGAIQL